MIALLAFGRLSIPIWMIPLRIGVETVLRRRARPECVHRTLIVPWMVVMSWWVIGILLWTFSAPPPVFWALDAVALPTLLILWTGSIRSQFDISWAGAAAILLAAVGVLVGLAALIALPIYFTKTHG